jgi:O-antigen ligase
LHALQRAPRQRVLDRVVPLLAGTTVVAFAAGSSSVPRVTSAAHGARWALLAALLVGSALWALPRPAVRRAPAAAAATLVGLALLSTAWSVEPRITFERALTLGALFCTCGLLASAVKNRVDRARALLGGLLAGAAVVGLAGLLLLAVDHGRAVEAASYEAPARFRGFGEDPNTVALLFGVAAPLALWAVLEGRRRLLSAGTLALLVGEIVASGSRGGLVAAAAGSVVVLAARLRSRSQLVAGLAAVAVLTGVGAGIQSIPKPSVHAAPAAPAAPSQQPRARPGYVDAETSYPLDADVGRPLPGGGEPSIRRSFFGGSGRLDAWRGALHQAALRPVTGHGFGTEQDVFVDRYYSFVGGLPENSYIGLALQLGIVGLLALAGLVVVLAAAGFRALRGPGRGLAAAGLGVLAAGLVAAVFQSYLYSVGNIAAATLWIPAFLLASAPDA